MDHSPSWRPLCPSGAVCVALCVEPAMPIQPALIACRSASIAGAHSGATHVAAKRVGPFVAHFPSAAGGWPIAACIASGDIRSFSSEPRRFSMRSTNIWSQHVRSA